MGKTTTVNVVLNNARNWSFLPLFRRPSHGISCGWVTCLSNDPLVIFIWRLCVNFNEIPHDFSMIEPSCKWDTSQFYKGYEQLTSWETYRSTLMTFAPLALWHHGSLSKSGWNGEVMASSWDIYEVYGQSWMVSPLVGVPPIETGRSETQVLRRRRALQGRWTLRDVHLRNHVVATSEWSWLINEITP